MKASPPDECPALSLAGPWQLALDAADQGLAGRWFDRPLDRATVVQLPGSLAAQRIGDDVTADTAWTGTIFDRAFYESPDYARYREPGRVKIPFFLQPEKTFTGPAWFQREIDLPAEWSGRRVTLTLERPHWWTTVWLDGRELGSRDSLSVAHEYDLGPAVPGRHRLTLRIDNRLLVAVGENAHSVSDHTQGNWNGCVGRIELRARSAASIDDLQVTPHVSTRSITVRGTVRNPAPGQTVIIEITAAATAAVAANGSFSTELELGAEAALWDEFTPVLHTLTARLSTLNSRPSTPGTTIRFGLREITTRGPQFLLNGRPVFFRGALDCCVFPLTGHPPTDVKSWRKILRTVQAHGLNHVRFHSWCPPEAAFTAGDELGVYFQVEAATWPNAAAVLAFNSPAGIGDGAPVDEWTLAESERIVRAYGNHPCFVLMAAGNEPGGPHHRDYLARWLTHMRAFDPRRLYTGAAGWPELSENQFHVIPEPRCHQWGDGLKSRLNALAPATTADYRDTVARRDRPVIAHEIGQWCVYPSLPDATKYTGHLKPRSYEIFANSLAAHHLADHLDAFIAASGRLQALCYKEEIESALRTPGLGGFQLLGLQDFPGQGTAPVGVLNALGEDKGYLSAADFRRFCGPAVPLARLTKRVFTTGETLEADLEVAWFRPEALPGASATWALVNETGHALLSGRLPPRPLAVGNANPLGRLRAPLENLPVPGRYKLVVQLEGTPFANDWDLWIYPAAGVAEPLTGVTVTSSLAEAEGALQSGGKVLFLVPPATVANGVAFGFTPIFWNTSCTQGQAPHTLGILCDPAHPALAGFPTESHANWQWWHLVTRAAPLILDALPRGLQPVVQVIDDWFSNRRLGLVFEVRVGPGRLLVCSIGLADDLAGEPVARQLRGSLLGYMQGGGFNPSEMVSLEALRAVLPP